LENHLFNQTRCTVNFEKSTVIFWYVTFISIAKRKINVMKPVTYYRNSVHVIRIQFRIYILYLYLRPNLFTQLQKLMIGVHGIQATNFPHLLYLLRKRPSVYFYSVEVTNIISYHIHYVRHGAINDKILGTATRSRI